ncbi:QacE family quaternary ammonium compound efflux SMR transporter [Aristophania vespae]|uniref:Guanidinium exporter n=1 Tax=Aristophania vespae TaxID=2697033 RepID=A0A6P1NFC8_9PROT|nr:multidrug efflux SMR transporter [Aristophania vespae]QHI95144.1 QacE family quaternary ammonium compound efflux SMR transporter [Aristophania vespae]UMM64360.1 putative guanidinium efflux system subunit GdnD [Aristophania vespae]
MSWFYLVMSGLLEIGFTTCLRFVKSWLDIGWAIGVVFFLAASIACFQLATRTIPLGTGYAIWTALGTVGTVLFGVLFFQEPISLLRFGFITGILFCVIGLKVTGG